MAKDLDDRPFLQALQKAPNRSFRRYILVVRNDRVEFERDPICKAFDEILEELYGLQADPE